MDRMQLRRRNIAKEVIQEEDVALPYDGKVVMAKKKKSEGLHMIILQGVAVCFALWLLYFAWKHPDSLQFYVTWAYAHLGHSHAQHLVGQKYLQGYAVEKNNENAVYWFRKAAEQGHPEASYNLAVAHLKGIPTHIKHDREVHNLLQNAANQKMEEAEKVYAHWCSHKPCDELMRESSS